MEALENAMDKINEIKDNLSGLFKTEVLDSVKQYGLDKLNETWTEIENSAAIFQRTGYSITNIQINVGIPPTLCLSLDQENNISDDEEKNLLEEYKDRTVIYTILLALFKANAIQQSIISTQYKFTGLNLEIGLNPSMQMKFSKVLPVA